MRRATYLTSLTLIVALTSLASADADDKHLGGMKLLPGYKHQPLQGIDSIVGKVTNPKGLDIMYEIGGIPKAGAPRFGGQFSDRPKLMPKDQLRWYQEQTVNGQPVHLAHRKDDYLMVSFPKKGMNISVKVTTPQEMAEALLMILTIPEPVEKKAK